MLAKLLCKIPILEARIPVIANLNDEHGNGAIKRAHVLTFQAFLNVVRSALKKEKENKRVQEKKQEAQSHDHDEQKRSNSEEGCDEFVQSLQRYISEKTWQEGLACLGAIEAVYTLVSSQLNLFAHSRLSLDPEAGIPDFGKHEKVDETHARDLLRPLTIFDKSSTDPAYRKMLEQACQTGISLLERTYHKMAHDLKIAQRETEESCPRFLFNF